MSYLEQVASPHHARIQLDAPGATFTPGQTISGQIDVTGVQPDGGELLVEIHAYSTGHRGQRGMHVIASQVLYDGRWDAGVSHSHRFALLVPRAMSGYRGTLFTVDTRLAAVTLLRTQGRTKGGARRLPAAWVPIQIAPDARPVCVIPNDASMIQEAYVGCALLQVGCIAALAVGLGLGALSLYEMQYQTLVLIVGVLAAVFVGATLLSIYTHLKQGAIRRRIGTSHLWVQPQPDGIGIEVRCQRLEGVGGGRAVILVEERAQTVVGRTKKGGLKVHKAQHQLHRQVVNLAPQPHAATLSGTLPYAAIGHLPPSHDDGWNRIAWRLELCVPIVGAPDLEWTMPLQAGPGGEVFPDSVIATNG